ncbi:Ig-like domain-containing protein [Soonwooa sp.]|uniref:Ig-like domain-containing protein n=1 Tax=Soonwooa sp. TaxID=1938592 RepID=UPI0028ACDEEB|nr:Ig-like domain-containing protein [Soonwooa sp.]
MKKIALFVNVIAVNFLFAQSSLVLWNNKNLTPNTKNNLISAENLTSTVTLSADKDNQTFFNTENWPTPNYNNQSEKTLDPNKYLQFVVKPKIGNQINISKIDLDYRMQGNSAKMEVRYSLDPNFSNYKVLLEDQNISGNNWQKLSLTDFSQLPSQTILSGKALYIRIYIYQTNNRFQIRYTENTADGPTIYGTASAQVPTVPIPANDNVTTTKNNDVTIDAMSNDFYQTTAVLSIAKSPLHGALTVNKDQTITYTPEESYVGKDSFYYILQDSTGTSNQARVDIDVTQEKNISLIQWDNTDLSAHSLNSNVSGNPVKSVGLTLNGGTWSEPFFMISNLPKPNQAIDFSKYVEFNIEAINKQIDLKTFDLEYQANGGSGFFKIQYSKDQNFKNGVQDLTGEIAYSNKWTTSSFSFGADNILLPGEKLYIRLYPYKSYNDLLIRLSKNPLYGPAIKGILSNYNKTNWVKLPSPHWDNGVPNLLKSATIIADYDTSSYGSIEASNLTVNASAKLKINNDDYIKIANSITNLGSAENIVMETDANILQINNAPNIGNIIVKRTTKLPKMGYNYWSAPVTGQNLYQFSDGYNQAINPANPQGTPWNRFYVYNEATDYFVNAVANEIKLDVNSEFQKSRGYAIRGKNSFPTVLTPDSPVVEFKFTGIPNNGNIESFILKYTNDSHGFNMVGNPYPSNIDLDKFFFENIDLIQPIVYLWTNNDMSMLTQQGANYNGNNYAIYNRMGGIPATYKGLNRNIPRASLKATQGFIVQAKPTGKNKALRFTNAMRTSEDGIFFNYKVSDKNRYWLNLKSDMDINNDILIGYMDDATNDFDEDLDTELLSIGDDAIWSDLNNKKLGIQARSWASDASDVVKLGVKISQTGNYTISLGDMEGIFANGQSIYIKDKSNSNIIDLTQQSYSFYAEKGSNDNRFEIVYKKPEITLTTSEEKKEIQIYKAQNAFVVSSKTDFIENIEIYDMLGRMIYQAQPNHKTVEIETSKLTKGMFIMKIKTKTFDFTKKIIN